MKMLFLLSTNIWFDHLSGEQDAKALNLGFSLLGIQCDFVGIDAEDFNEYDVYVVFSMSPDVQEKIKFIEQDKTVIVVPQIGDHDQTILDRLAESSSMVKNFYVLARNDEEATFFSSVCSDNQIIQVGGWFVEPFIWNEEPPSCVKSSSLVNDDYVLSFLGDELDERTILFIQKSDPKLIRVVVSSKRCFDRYFSNCILDTVECKKFVKYGSLEWFTLLSNAKYYFEPNSCLTSAMLEIFWLGGEVVSPNYQSMNSMLGMPLVVEKEGDLSGVSKRQKRNCIARYRVENIAQAIIFKIKEKF